MAGVLSIHSAGYMIYRSQVMTIPRKSPRCPVTRSIAFLQHSVPTLLVPARPPYPRCPTSTARLSCHTFWAFLLQNPVPYPQAPAHECPHSTHPQRSSSPATRNLESGLPVAGLRLLMPVDSAGDCMRAAMSAETSIWVQSNWRASKAVEQVTSPRRLS